jgi:hypothetical protein
MKPYELAFAYGVYRWATRLTRVLPLARILLPRLIRQSSHARST